MQRDRLQHTPHNCRPLNSHRHTSFASWEICNCHLQVLIWETFSAFSVGSCKNREKVLCYQLEMCLSMFLLDASVVKSEQSPIITIHSTHKEQCNSMTMFSIQCKHIFYTCHLPLVSLLVSIIAHFKVKDYGMGMYSFSSNNYKGCCLRIHTTLAQVVLTFNTSGSVHVQQQKAQQGKVSTIQHYTMIYFFILC